MKTPRTTKKSPATFDRRDFIGTRFVLAFIAVAVTAGSVIDPIFRWATDKPLTWQVTTGRSEPAVSDLVTAKPGVEVNWPGTVDVTIPDPDTWTRVATLVPGIVLATATVIVVAAFWRVLSGIRAERPFVPAAIRSLRASGITLVSGAIALVVTDAVANFAVSGAALDLHGGPSVFSFAGGTFFIVAATGLMCGVLAEGFAQGARLADDVEGLV